MSEVVRRLGVSRQSVHSWIARYEHGGLAWLADRSHRPASCPHQTPADVEAQICEQFFGTDTDVPGRFGLPAIRRRVAARHQPAEAIEGAPEEGPANVMSSAEDRSSQ